MTVETACVALRRTPWEFLATSWPWRSIAYVIAGACLLPVLLLTWAARCLPWTRPRTPIVELERSRLRLMATSSPAAAPAALTRQGRLALLAALCLVAPLNLVLLTGLTISLGLFLLPLYTVMSQVTRSWEELIAPAIGAVLAGATATVACLYAITLAAVLQARAARSMISRHHRTEPTLTEALLDTLDAERRRIERDLHDCTQQRLVTLGLTLAQAELMMPEADPATALITRARHETDRTLVELRELIHGIHPQILTERGLAAAIADLTARQAFGVAVDLAVPRRLPGSVESTAYFLVSEALTNIGKHSYADSVAVSVRATGARLAIRIVDNGVGGAQLGDRSTGMRGMARRVHALGGGLGVSSPPGGPTVLRAHLPIPAGRLTTM